MHQNLSAILHNVAQQLPLSKGGNPVFSRVPEDLRQRLNLGAQERALFASGVEIRCRVGDAGGSLILSVDGDEPVHTELYLGDYLLWTFKAGPGKHVVPLTRGVSSPWLSWRDDGHDVRTILAKLPRRRFHPELVRLVFTNKARIGLLDCTGDINPPLPGDVPQKTLLAYGSSITMGMNAIRMPEAYISLVAEALGLDCLNLGFGGSAFCEPEMATWIKERPDWNIGLLEMGINMGGMALDLFTQRIRTMVATVAGKTATRPVFILDQFRHFNDLPGFDNTNVAIKRQVVHDAVAELGGPQTVHIPIHSVPSIEGLCADLLHPSPQGMREMADYLVRSMQRSKIGTNSTTLYQSQAR